MQREIPTPLINVVFVQQDRVLVQPALSEHHPAPQVNGQDAENGHEEEGHGRDITQARYGEQNRVYDLLHFRDHIQGAKRPEHPEYPEPPSRKHSF